MQIAASQRVLLLQITIDGLEILSIELAGSLLQQDFGLQEVIAAAVVLGLRAVKLALCFEYIHRRTRTDFKSGLRCLQRSLARFKRLLQCLYLGNIAEYTEIVVADRAFGFARRALDAFVGGA